MTQSTRPWIRRLSRVGLACGMALSFYGYVTGWAAWQVLLALSAVPVAEFCVWMYTGRLRRYRILFGIYSVLAVIGAYEAWAYGKIPTGIATSIDLPKNPGEPDLYFEYDLPGVESELFPNAPDSLLLQAVQLNFCADTNLPFQQHPFCRKFDNRTSESIRELLETALAMQPKLNEDLYYSYVEVLMHEGAQQSAIDAATEEWKRLFPLSSRPDPRTIFADRRKVAR